ncbi:MAG: hypothetical protein V1904_13585 [Bacteroidota bacterium]
MTEQSKDNQEVVLIFARIYLFIRRYFFIFLIFILAGIVYGYYKNSSSGYYYKKHLTFSSIVVHKDISLDIVKSLQLLIDENNSTAIAKKLNIPVSAAASMMSVDTSSYRNKLNLGFVVDILFRDSAYGDTLTSGLIYFLNHNEYHQKNMQLFIEEKQNILVAVNKKLRAIDSANEGSNTSYSAVRGENAILVKSSSSEQIRLMEEKYELEKDIEFGSKITLMDETMVKVFSGIGLTKSFILYGLGFGILGLMLSLFIESLRLTRKVLQQRKD